MIYAPFFSVVYLSHLMMRRILILLIVTSFKSTFGKNDRFCVNLDDTIFNDGVIFFVLFVHIAPLYSRPSLFPYIQVITT
nr:MAG TPA: hypothetical protein [Caudoviricetes sp.]